MKIISVFNNKGGVGKSTLTYHLGNAMAEMDLKVLLLDLDPQCNLTICALMEEDLHTIWEKEDPYMDDFDKAIKEDDSVLQESRSIHFLLKPTEDGVSEITDLPPPLTVSNNTDIIPGRLSLHKYENIIAERWSGVYQGDNLAIRTVTNIRSICNRYAEKHEYDFVLIDTSPSLGILNKVIMSTVDGFFIPAQPDMFSLYGIRNIGNALNTWQREFQGIYSLISEDKRSKFPEKFVQFLGYTIYNAKKYTKGSESFNEYNLAQAHYQFVSRIPPTILEFIVSDNRTYFNEKEMSEPIGGDSIIHTHNTFPAMAQALKCPMWSVPEVYKNMQTSKPGYIEILTQNGFEYNKGNNGRLRELGEKYMDFARQLIDRINRI